MNQPLSRRAVFLCIERGDTMREILFRGKNPVSSEWAYGSLVLEKNAFDERLILTIISDADGNETLVIPETVGQYAGLYDKNGIKVFEGDIISGKSGRFKVTWCDSICSFIAAGMDEIHGLPSMNKGTLKYYEIIGNIYDNPELLTR